METEHQTQQLGIPQLRIVAGALMVSPIGYVVVGVVLHQTGFRHPLQNQILCWALLAAGAIGGFASIGLHSAFLSPSGGKRVSDGNTMNHFAKWTIVTMALAELPSGTGLVAFIVCGSAIVFAVGIALSLALGVMVFPTQGRYDAMCAGLETIPDEVPGEGGGP